MIAKASTADSQTIRSIVRTLPRRHCLILGKVVGKYLPMLVKVSETKFLTLGQTKRFFSRNGQERKLFPLPVPAPVSRSEIAKEIA